MPIVQETQDGLGNNMRKYHESRFAARCKISYLVVPNTRRLQITANDIDHRTSNLDYRKRPQQFDEECKANLPKRRSARSFCQPTGGSLTVPRRTRKKTQMLKYA